MTTEPAIVLVALAAIGLIAGIGITAVGPGGVLATVGLFLFTGLSPAMVAGTAIVTHVATGSLGTLVYLRSGQLRHPNTLRIALVLAVTALIGTPIGVLINFVVTGRLFAILLAAFVMLIAALVWYRRRDTTPQPQAEERAQMPA